MAQPVCWGLWLRRGGWASCAEASPTMYDRTSCSSGTIFEWGSWGPQSWPSVGESGEQGHIPEGPGTFGGQLPVLPPLLGTHGHPGKRGHTGFPCPGGQAQARSHLSPARKHHVHEGTAPPSHGAVLRAGIVSLTLRPHGRGKDRQTDRQSPAPAQATCAPGKSLHPAMPRFPHLHGGLR